jgi:hypothetical protein
VLPVSLSKNYAIPQPFERPVQETLETGSNQVDVHDRQKGAAEISSKGVDKLSADSARPQKIAAAAARAPDDGTKFYRDGRTGLIFAVAGGKAAIVINAGAGVPLAEGYAVTPGTFPKDVILPIANFKPSMLDPEDRVGKTAFGVGLNLTTAGIGIKVAHALQKNTRLPILAPTGTVQKIIYSASTLVPISLEANKDVVDYLKSKGLITNSGKPGERPEDWGQWAAVHVPNSAAIGVGVGIPVAGTLTYNGIRDALIKGVPIDAKFLFKNGAGAIKGSRLGFVVPAAQSILANAVVKYPGSGPNTSPTFDAVVNGVTGEVLFDLGKKIFTDPKQKRDVEALKRDANRADEQAKYRKKYGPAEGNIRYGSREQQLKYQEAQAKITSAAQADAAKLAKAEYRNLPLNQKIKQLAGPTSQYSRSILVALAFELILKYVGVQTKLHQRINNRDLRIISPGDAADTVKAINEVLADPLVQDGKVIANAVINLGKLVGRDFSDINTWGSPKFIKSLNDKKDQIYKKYPNLDLNPKRESLIPKDQQVQLNPNTPRLRPYGEPDPVEEAQAAAGVALYEENIGKEQRRIDNLAPTQGSQGVIDYTTLPNYQAYLQGVNSPKPSVKPFETGGILPQHNNLTNAQIIAKVNRDELAADASRKAETRRLIAQDQYYKDNPEPWQQNGSQSNLRPFNEAEHKKWQAEQEKILAAQNRFGKPLTQAEINSTFGGNQSAARNNVSNQQPFIPVTKVVKNTQTTSSYQQSQLNDIARFTRFPVDTKNPEKNTYKGVATRELGDAIKKLTQADIKKIRDMAPNTYISIGSNTFAIKIDKKTVSIATQVPNSNNVYVSERRTIP